MKTLPNKNTYLFDWGNTIMRDFPEIETPMYTWNEVETMPNVEEMLKSISQRADVFLATNAIVSTKEEIAKALARGGILQYFTDIFCYREFGVPKPSSEYFDKVFERISKPKEQVVMIGDNLEKDVIGALDYGIDAVLYDPEREHTDYEGWRITNLLELVS